MDWQPIDTAPKDGTRIILTDGGMVEVGCFAPDIHGDKYPWAFVDDYTGRDTTSGEIGVPCNAWDDRAVTHWMPLPPAPRAVAPGDAATTSAIEAGAGNGDPSWAR